MYYTARCQSVSTTLRAPLVLVLFWAGPGNKATLVPATSGLGGVQSSSSLQHPMVVEKVISSGGGGGCITGVL